MNKTYGDLLGAHDIAVPRHLEEQAEIPILTGLQIQGDVAIIPIRPPRATAAAVPPAGVPVVRGESGGNTHLLVGEGGILWAPVDRSVGGQDLGVLTVPEDGVAYLLHPEHGGNGTRRRFGLTVPADMPDAVTAAAWTYRLSSEEYAGLERRT